METVDRQQLLRLLTASRKKLLESAEGLTDEQARLRPAEDRWSILECVEHAGLVEDAMFASVTTTLVPPETSIDRAREQKILSGVTDRTQKFGAPDGVKPTGKFATLVEAIEHFERSRARTIDYVEKCQLDLRALVGPHPALGQATGQELMIILALHPARHALQILEAREALGLE
jgi:hypothetical protein